MTRCNYSNRIGKHYFRDGNLLYLEDSQFDSMTGREHHRAEYYHEGKIVHNYDLSLRRYTYTEFNVFLKMTGFIPVNVYGDFDGSSFRAYPPSKRMIVFAQKV